MDTNRDLARKVEALEKKYDEQFAEVLPPLKNLLLRRLHQKGRLASIPRFGSTT
jgi:hypothetical protein